MSIPGLAKNSSSVVGDDVFKPPRVELRPFDHRQFTPRLIDCWDALQRSSVDVASQPSLERNLFAFYDHCFFLVTVHDADLALKKAKDVDRKKMAKSELQTFHQNMISIPGGTSSNPSVDTAWTDTLDCESHSVSSANANNAQPSSDACSQHGIISPTARGSSPTHPPTSGPTWAYDDDDADMDDLPSDAPAPDQGDLIGIAYLAPVTGTASVAHELSLGIALLPHARGRGFGTETALKLLARAFDDFGCHRVSVSVLGPIDRPTLLRASSSAPGHDVNAQGNRLRQQADQLKASVTKTETETILRMFVSLGFFVEGRRRRAVPGLIENGVWRDAHYLAMLDTDWYNLQRRSQSLPRHTRWDEMLARHQSEREVLASAESRLKKSTSVETLRPGDAVASTASTVASSAMSASESGKGQSILDAASSVSSVAEIVSDPFCDSLLSQSVRRPLTRASSFSSSNIGQGDAEESGYGEYISEHFSVKVENYLWAHPAPGPPSEVDSDPNSDSEGGFESCSDHDEVETLKTPNGKGKARGTAGQLLHEGNAQPVETSTFFLSNSPATDMSQQLRDKRRLSTTSGDSGAHGSMTFQFIANARLEMDLDSSELETQSVLDNSTMSWEAVSDGAHSPSPSPYLSSDYNFVSSKSVSDD